jgi:hypothetical protein
LPSSGFPVNQRFAKQWATTEKVDILHQPVDSRWTKHTLKRNDFGLYIRQSWVVILSYCVHEMQRFAKKLMRYLFILQNLLLRNKYSSLRLILMEIDWFSRSLERVHWAAIYMWVTLQCISLYSKPSLDVTNRCA